MIAKVDEAVLRQRFREITGEKYLVPGLYAYWRLNMVCHVATVVYRDRKGRLHVEPMSGYKLEKHGLFYQP